MASPATLNPVADGYAAGFDATYATARDTAGGGAATTKLAFGQVYSGGYYECDESGCNFDTGAEVPDDATVTVATLKLYGRSSSKNQDFNIQVGAYDWGDTWTAGDFRTAAQLAALSPVLASYATSGGWVTNNYNVFTSTGDFLAAISKTGYTRLIIFSDRHAAGTTPTGDENLEAYAVVDGTRKPQLYLEYTVPSAGIGKLAWWFSACKWRSPWEPRESGLLVPRITTPELVF